MMARVYRPPWWCRNRHLQTVWGPLFCRRRLALRRERVTTPDGDFVDLDWLDAPGQPGRGGTAAGRTGGPPPLVLLLHGLEGSWRSHYVTGVFAEAAARGWRAAVLNFRSCSGELNRLPRFYHSGDTGDLDAVVRRLAGREPGIRIGAIGISLGGNVLLKWLGECGAATPGVLEAAATVSVPFDLAACARTMDRGLNRAVYTANFLRTMRRKVVAKARRYPGFADLAAVRRSRTFAEYDRAMTAPVHGFRDEVDYWIRASCRPYLAAIRRPTLLINALDDPFVPAHALPDAATLPPGVRAEFVGRGGHVGFVEGRWPWRARSWAERRAVAFLAAQFAANHGPDGRPAGPSAPGDARPRTADAAGVATAPTR